METGRDWTAAATLVDVLKLRASAAPDSVIYHFLEDGENVNTSFTFGELERLAREIGGRLQQQFSIGDRVLLVVPPGPHAVTGFLGAVVGGMVPVPIYPPQDAAAVLTVRKIAADAAVSGLLTCRSMYDALQKGGVRFDELPVFIIDEPSDAPPLRDPGLTRDHLAFLQYTSGSTGDPKGVMVAHRTLLLTCRDIDQAFLHDAQSVMVSWLPTFHDMGLIYGVLLPMLVGFPCYLMSPVSFLRRPIRWLRAITNFGGTHSAAPNFAYELCVRKTNAEEWRSLDLRSWRVASNGAEPIRASTLDEFAAAFASSGFRGERFCPSYGLAEATLKVSTTRTGIPPRVLDADVEELERGRFVAADVSQPARRIVGCGTSTIGAVIAIVDPQTLSERGACEIGEIWVSSPSVALGYWRRPEQTEQTFHAHTADGRGPFLRTGDLGFLLDGELFVTGRLKDLIILRGRNHYPHDIESTAERAHPAVRPGCSTAFLVSDGSGGEVLALLVEIQTERAAEAAEVLRNVRASISRDHRIAVEHLAIYPAGTLPKTSSGKVRRAASRELFLSGATPTIAEWHRAS